MGKKVHHDHYISVNAQSPNGNCERETEISPSDHQNIQYPCNFCNLHMYPYRKIPIFSHQFSRHIHFIIQNFSQKGLKHVKIYPYRQTDDYMGLCIKNKFLFLDASRQFGDKSLKELMLLHNDIELQL